MQPEPAMPLDALAAATNAAAGQPLSRIGPFLVNPAGVLELREHKRVPVLRFRWQQRSVYVRIGTAASAASRLDALTATIVAARVPSTGAGTADAGQRRAGAFRAIRMLQAVVKGSWSIRLLPDHTVALIGQRSLDRPLVATSLLSELTLAMLDAAPYLELVATLGRELDVVTLPPAGPAGGTVKT